MDQLSQLISCLNKEEVRHFKLMFKGAKDEQLSLLLFNSIRQYGKEKGEVRFRKDHYDASDNAFYRLKNRLLNDLQKSLLNLHFSRDPSHRLSELIMFARILADKEQYELAHRFLQKAERKATAIEDFELLSLIYNDLIKLSFQLTEINPQEIIALSKENSVRREKMNELQHVLAIVNHRLKRSQNIGDKSTDILSLLDDVLDRYQTDPLLSESPQFRFSIYNTVIQHLLRRNEFVQMEKYLEDTYREFEERKLFNRQNHETRVKMLSFLINACFKNGNREKSLSYSEILYDELQRHNGLMYSRYIFFYYQSLVMNYSQERPQRAIDILEELIDDNELVSNEYYRQFIELNLSLLYLQTGKPNRAIIHLRSMYHNPQFKDSNEFLKAQCRLLESIALCEIEDYSQCLHCLKQLERAAIYKENKSIRELVKTLTLLADRPDYQFSPALIKKVRNHLSEFEENRSSDDFLIDYKETILNLINK